MTADARKLDFSNTKIAFASMSNLELMRARFLFKMMGFSTFVKAGPRLASMSLRFHLPVRSIIKNTLFKQFCGGESIGECSTLIDKLSEAGIGTILDFATEGINSEKLYDYTMKETLRNIDYAATTDHIPFCVFKVTGLARFKLLERVSEDQILSLSEQEEYKKVKDRIDRIAATAAEKKVRLFIDAEESWIQDSIDELTWEAILKYNKEEPIIFNTIQMYRHDRFAFLKKMYEEACREKVYLGIKLVRGAYLEKENDRAKVRGEQSPIHKSKLDTDQDYDEALRYCIEHIEQISVCAGTHNEPSTLLLANLIDEYNLDRSDYRAEFAQLMGMSDNLTFNLADQGYRVSKYVPYGPIATVIPYLGRRAAENSSIAGQTSRELQLIESEVQRRGLLD